MQRVGWRSAFMFFLLAAIVLSSVGTARAEGTSKPSIRDMLKMQQEAENMGEIKHSVVVYFAGWHLGEENPTLVSEVAGLPWDKVTHINHAFWYVEPADGSTESSFERRLSGLGARTEFRIVPMLPELDCGDQGQSSLVSGLPRNHFAQYDYFSKLYPDVTIMLSLGGWTKSGYFSEMAFTKEGRASFISSCLDVMAQYPWIGGIDIDWEYPAGSRDGERKPDANDPGDQGCCIFGTPSQDRENFALMLAELKAAMEETYGPGVKKLTACASGSVGWTLPCQDWAAAAPSLDLINIMSYDLAGIWDGITGHAASAALGKGGAMYMRMQGIPLSKVCIGSPLYGTPFQMKEITRMPLGSSCEQWKPVPTEACTMPQLLAWEAEAVSGYEIVSVDGHCEMTGQFDTEKTGWHQCYDTRNGAPYIYNDDENSPCYKWFISYENPLSLQEKLDYIQEKGIGGIIVWEASQDTADYRMISLMAENLLN